MTLPAHSFTAQQQARYDYIEARYAGQTPRLLVIGDSRCQQWPNAQLKTVAHKRANMGISVSRPQDTLYQLQNTTVNLSKLTDAILITGVNSLTHDGSTPSDIAGGITACVAAIKAHAPACRVFASLIWPFSDRELGTNANRVSTNSLIASDAAAGGYTVFDPGLSDPTDLTRYKPDHLHLIAAGYSLNVTPAAITALAG